MTHASTFDASLDTPTAYASAPHVDATPISDEPMNSARRVRTLTFNWPSGPFVVDIWEPQRATDAPPILLIHGWGGSGTYWQELARELSASARVIVPDLPGTGRSQPVTAPQNMFDQVATLSRLLEELNLKQVQINGHSMGGAMTLLLADAQPDRVSRLALTSTCFFLNEQQERTYRAIMEITYLTLRFRPSWLPAVPGIERFMGARYFYRLPDNQRLLRAGLVDYLELDRATAIACANNATDPAIPAAGRRVQVPTLLIACRQDQVMPVENVDYTAQQIPNCDVHWINRCGHLPMVEKPEEYLSIMREFLDLGT